MLKGCSPKKWTPKSKQTVKLNIQKKIVELSQNPVNTQTVQALQQIYDEDWKAIDGVLIQPNQFERWDYSTFPNQEL